MSEPYEDPWRQDVEDLLVQLEAQARRHLLGARLPTDLSALRAEPAFQRQERHSAALRTAGALPGAARDALKPAHVRALRAATALCLARATRLHLDEQNAPRAAWSAMQAAICLFRTPAELEQRRHRTAQSAGAAARRITGRTTRNRVHELAASLSDHDSREIAGIIARLLRLTPRHVRRVLKNRDTS